MNGKCFISHASDDKESFVRPLALELKRRGINIWYDEFTLKPGDSLRRSIDRGLSESEAGIVVLSSKFFQKEWPQRELDALLGNEISGRGKLYPVWHRITADEVRAVSPLLADKFAISSDIGVVGVADALSDVLPMEPFIDGRILADKLEMHLDHETFALEYLRTGCEHRFFQLQAYFKAYEELISKRTAGLDDEEFDATIDDIIRAAEPEKLILQVRFGLPNDVEIVPDESLPESRIRAWTDGLEDWVAGTMQEDDVYSFVGDLDNYFEIDYLYILLGVPIYSVSQQQRGLLDEAIKYIGMWVACDRPVEIEKICQQLRGS